MHIYVYIYISFFAKENEKKNINSDGLKMNNKTNK